MSDTIQLSDGTTTISLNASAAGAKFQALANAVNLGLPPHENLMHTSDFSDGDVLVRERLGNRRWAMRLKIDSNSSDDQIADQLIALNRFVRQARRHWVKKDVDKVYLEISLSGSSTTTKYDVVDIEYDVADIFDYFNRQSGDVKFGDAFAIQVVTKPWGYGDTVSLVSSQTIQNCTDDYGTGRVHYIDVTAGDVVGDLPAPTIIKMKNVEDSSLRRFWISKRDREDHDIDIVLDDTEAVSALGTPTTATAATYVYGQTSTVTLSTDDTWVSLMKWDLDPSDIKEWGGKFLVLLIGHGASAGQAAVKYKVRTKFADLTTWSETGVTQGTGDKITPIGIIDILPGFRHDGGKPFSKAGVSSTIEIQGYTTDQPKNINIDCLYLLPLDGLRVMSVSGAWIEQNDVITDDGIDEWFYVNDPVGGKATAILSAIGNSIILEPNKAQRLYFTWRHASFDASQEMEIDIDYQPRTEFLLGS